MGDIDILSGTIFQLLMKKVFFINIFKDQRFQISRNQYYAIDQKCG